MDNNCQLMLLSAVPDKIGVAAIFFQRLKKLRLSVWRRLRFFRNVIIIGRKPPGNDCKNSFKTVGIKAGDLVKIKSKEEIRKTLDGWNKLKGCGFMDEMEEYCGTVQKVKKKVEFFMDERDYLIKKCKNIVLLENVFCQGVKLIGRCDRSCHFFWRVEWLELLAFPMAGGDVKDQNGIIKNHL
jgi:hypothetical protein